MTLAEVNWKNFLEPGSEQPPDVFFTILEEEQQTTEETSEQDGAKAVFTFGPPSDESLNGAPAPKKRSSDSSPEKEPTSSTSSGTDPASRPNVVAAHKFLLAGASQVFRRQFLGSLKENSNVVVIKETTFEAFSTTNLNQQTEKFILTGFMRIDVVASIDFKPEHHGRGCIR